MQNTANTIRFFTCYSSRAGIVDHENTFSLNKVVHQTLIGRLAGSANSQIALGTFLNRLIRAAEHAYSLRDLKSLEEVSFLLMNLPLPEARHIGLYYQAITIKRSGDKGKAKAELEKVADIGPLEYRARAIQTLGVIQHEQKNYNEAIRFHLETLHASKKGTAGGLAHLLANLEIGFLKSDEGDHAGALNHLENLLPVVELAVKHHPLYFYLYNNALAVEFAELGRINEAEAAIKISLASPFASAYPEWSETRDEIEQKRNYPDPSRCFIEHAHTKQEAVPDSTANTSVKVDIALQLEHVIELKTVRVSMLCVNQSIYQRSSIKSNADSAISPGGSAQSILQLLGKSVQSRGPPAFYFCS